MQYRELMQIDRLRGLEGAARAAGPTVVIDTFRAFTTAAVAHDRGVSRHILVESVADATTLGARLPDAILCGEEKGVKPAGFDLGNSPVEMLSFPIGDRTLIQRTTSGTGCVLRALRAGADPVYAAALVTATATAWFVREQDELSIVAAGTHGVHPAPEDDVTADYLGGVVKGSGNPLTAHAMVDGAPTAIALRSAEWADAGDVDICADVDRYAFALLAHLRDDGHAELVRIDPPEGSGFLDMFNRGKDEDAETSD